MFFIKKIRLSNFKTKNVIAMDGMFGDCKSLEELDLSNFSTPVCRAMGLMFNGCFSIKKLKIQWDKCLELKKEKHSRIHGITAPCMS